jgi:hypothetical protein
MTYSLTFNLDGEERTEPVADAKGEASALAIAKDAFERAISKRRPKEAYCAVFKGDGDEAEPLGVWDFQAGRRPLLVWEPARD